ncbi:MAG TPA: hypothetical protein VLA48_02985 [Nitrososphaeraceae archaeon]|nr:hypothetical protein [Nitrososphaeraceae archaeon]
MQVGDKITMYFDCFGVTSEEEVTVRSVDRNGITLQDHYFNGKDDEEYYLFSVDTGKCLNEPKFGFGGKRYLKTIL